MDGKYYMVQGARTGPHRGEVLIFQSEDKMHDALQHYHHAPDFRLYGWECPDLFELMVSGSCAIAAGQTMINFQNVYACGLFRCTGISAEIVHWVSSRRGQGL